MKILEITTPSGGKLELTEPDAKKVESMFGDPNKILVAKMIDGELHIVQTKAEPK